MSEANVGRILHFYDKNRRTWRHDFRDFWKMKQKKGQKDEAHTAAFHSVRIPSTTVLRLSISTKAVWQWSMMIETWTTMNEYIERRKKKKIFPDYLQRRQKYFLRSIIMMSDFLDDRDDDRTTIFLQFYEKGGAFYVQVFQKRLSSKCREWGVTEDREDDPQSPIFLPSDG